MAITFRQGSPHFEGFELIMYGVQSRHCRVAPWPALFSDPAHPFVASAAFCCDDGGNRRKKSTLKFKRDSTPGGMGNLVTECATRQSRFPWTRYASLKCCSQKPLVLLIASVQKRKEFAGVQSLSQVLKDKETNK